MAEQKALLDSELSSDSDSLFGDAKTEVSKGETINCPYVILTRGAV